MTPTFSQVENPILDSLVSATINHSDIPSMAVAYIQPDATFYGIDGVVRNDSDEPVRLTDKYHLGSNTKAVTSFLAFRLIEKGEIKLNTKFVDLFPELNGEIRSDYVNITLGDLMSHNAGIRPYTSGMAVNKIPTFAGTTTDKRLSFAKYAMSKKPAKIGEYSNGGLLIASLMMEKASGKSYEELLDETFTELDLDYFIGFPNKENISQPWGHIKEKKNLKALGPDDEYKLPDYFLPAGDLSMSIVDYAKFIQIHINGFLEKDSTLSKDSYKKLFYDKADYSYGWGNQINDKGNLVFHDGSAGTYYCHTLISTTYNFALIIVMKSATDEDVEELYKVQGQILGARKRIK